jgi:hypothetical protein
MTKLDKIMNLTHYYMKNMQEDPEVIRLALTAYFSGMNEENLNQWITEYERPTL